MKRMKIKYASFYEAKKHFSDAYHAKNVAFTLKVNYLLLTSRTLKEHVEEIAKLKRSQNINNNDMRDEGTVKAHIKFLKKRNFVVEQKNDKYRITDYIPELFGANSLSSDQNSGIKESDYEYLPTKSDCERVIKKISRLTIVTDIDLEELWVGLKKDLTEKGKTLKSNWKIITKENLKLWFK